MGGLIVGKRGRGVVAPPERKEREHNVEGKELRGRGGFVVVVR